MLTMMTKNNLMDNLAADYVRTHTDLATMEAANEAARRAVNGILCAAGSSARSRTQARSIVSSRAANLPTNLTLKDCREQPFVLIEADRAGRQRELAGELRDRVDGVAGGGGGHGAAGALSLSVHAISAIFAAWSATAAQPAPATIRTGSPSAT